MFSRKEELRQLRKQLIENGESDIYRRTGRTTADCMEIIAKALRNPDMPIRLYDHTGDKLVVIKKVTIPTLNDIITKLGLQDLAINLSNFTLTYELNFKDETE